MITNCVCGYQGKMDKLSQHIPVDGARCMRPITILKNKEVELFCCPKCGNLKAAASECWREKEVDRSR